MVKQWQDINHNSRYSQSYMHALPNFIKLIEFQSNRAYALFKKGEELFPLITKRFRTDIKLFSLGGIKILDKIKSRGYRINNNSPKLTKLNKIEIIFKAIISK